MSQIKTQQPIIHIPSYRRLGVDKSSMVSFIQGLGLEMLYPGVHGRYWYTDVDGVAALLPHLILKSSLYKPAFTCINYAFRVWNEASRLYSLNTWVPVIGRIPNSDNRHAWQLILVGDERGLSRDASLYFEPNDGWDMGELELAYQAFPVGEEGYTGEMIFF